MCDKEREREAHLIPVEVLVPVFQVVRIDAGVDAVVLEVEAPVLPHHCLLETPQRQTLKFTK